MVQVIIVVNNIIDPFQRICGVPIIIRLLREIYTAGIRDVVIVGEAQARKLSILIQHGAKIGLSITNKLDDISSDLTIIIPSNIVLDEMLIRQLLKSDPGTFFVVERNNEIAVVAGLIGKRDIGRVFDIITNRNLDNLKGFKIINIDDLVVYYPRLRRKLKVLAVPIMDKKDIKKASRTIVSRTQKGLHITSEINRIFENALTYALCRFTWVTPNRITILANILGFLTAFLFLTQKPILAIIVAFITAIIDGVDGKMARVRGIGTRLGEIEHSFDMLYEQVIYISWIYFVYTVYNDLTFLFLGFIFLLSDTFTRHVYMQFKMSTGKNMLLMSKLDRFIAKIDGRRNVWFFYMLIGIIIEPVIGLYLMLIHSIITSIVYAIRAMQHLSKMDRDEGTKEWLELVYKDIE